MAFVGKPNVAFQSPQWDGTKWITTAISSSGGSSSGVSATTAFDVVTASLTSSYSFPTQPAWSNIVSVTSSWTDTMFWGKVSGVVGGANTIWLRLLVDSGSANVSSGAFGGYSTYIETVNNGAGFGGTIHGRITGLSPGIHTFTIQGVKGSSANTPTITPGAGDPQQGAVLTLMNLSASITSPTITTGIGPKVTKIFENLAANGASPSTPVTNWTGSFVATGQPCIFFISATGFNSSATQRNTMYFKIDGQVVASSSLFNNEVEHLTFPTIMYPATLTPGTHTVRIELTGSGGTSLANSDDWASLIAVEFSSSVTTAASQQWSDAGNKLYTTSSVVISSGSDNIVSASQKGPDVWVFVSGTVGQMSGTSNTPRRVLFGGDVVSSGSFSTALAPIYGPMPFSNSSSWIPINTGSATITDEFGTIFMSKPSAAGPNACLLFQSSSKVPYTATALFAFTPTIGAVAGLGGIYLRESSSGKLIGFGFHWNTGPTWRTYLHKLNSPTSANSDYLANNNALFATYTWLQIEDNGTNRIHRMSYDGRYFFQINSVSRTDFMTPDMVGWGIDTQGGAAQIRLVSWRIE